MKIVIDSNRVFASLLKDGTARKILYTDYFEFIAPEFIKEEIFWNNIMAEHSKFIRGLLDPSEEDLQNISNNFANKFDELTDVAKKTDQYVYDLAGITNQSLEESKKIKAFKEKGAEGLLNCKIKSIILPLLADHVLREANH